VCRSPVQLNDVEARREGKAHRLDEGVETVTVGVGGLPKQTFTALDLHGSIEPGGLARPLHDRSRLDPTASDPFSCQRLDAEATFIAAKIAQRRPSDQWRCSQLSQIGSFSKLGLSLLALSRFGSSLQLAVDNWVNTAVAELDP
jgi:hypothetical protein